MALTSAQKATLKAAIVADSPANALYQAGDLSGLADYYNTTVSPAFYVYRTSVPVQDINDQIIWANFTPNDPPDGTTIWTNRSMAAQGKQFNLQTLLIGSQGAVNAAKSNVRAGLQDALTGLPTGASGASVSAGWVGVRDTVIARAASRFEKLFATGNGGTAATAATMAAEGPIAYTEFVSL